MFTGEYRHALDGKGRIAVPARFRSELAGGAFISRWIDACVAIFPRSSWDDFATKVAGLPVTDAGARTFARFVFSGAFEFELDGQGRVVVPLGLREFADLQGEVVVVGARDHVELWSPTRWADYSAAMYSPDALAEHLQGLGI
ncbi:MAG: division/cell wall cluster transcriptional repressor MraZ [Chloroflexi bacterium]|nr:division/cell wall cluster transcriptional repressor MraZ [Chloroflexota bacterium]